MIVRFFQAMFRVFWWVVARMIGLVAALFLAWCIGIVVSDFIGDSCQPFGTKILCTFQLPQWSVPPPIPAIPTLNLKGGNAV